MTDLPRHAPFMASVLIQKARCIAHAKMATKGMVLFALISMNVTRNEPHVLHMQIAPTRMARSHVAVKMATLVMDTHALTFTSVKSECIHVQSMHSVQILMGHTNAPANLGSQEMERHAN